MALRLSPEERARRAAICAACPARVQVGTTNVYRCSQCGCALIKFQFRGTRCPIAKF